MYWAVARVALPRLIVTETSISGMQLDAAKSSVRASVFHQPDFANRESVLDTYMRRWPTTFKLATIMQVREPVVRDLETVSYCASRLRLLFDDISTRPPTHRRKQEVNRGARRHSVLRKAVSGVWALQAQTPSGKCKGFTHFEILRISRTPGTKLYTTSLAGSVSVTASGPSLDMKSAGLQDVHLHAIGLCYGSRALRQTLLT